MDQTPASLRPSSTDGNSLRVDDPSTRGEKRRLLIWDACAEREAYLIASVLNSAPLAMLSGQRCMTLL
jgi:hypothetical protein